MDQSECVIAVFGSHKSRQGSSEYEAARLTGMLLAQNGFVVATGGYSGIMSAASEGARAASGQVIGVTCSTIEQLRGARLNKWVTEEIHYRTLSERVFHLVRENRGMIVFPGGVGTLSEFALAWSLIQVNEINARPLIMFGEPWPGTLEAFVRRPFVADGDLSLLDLTNQPEEILEILLKHR